MAKKDDELFDIFGDNEELKRIYFEMMQNGNYQKDEESVLKASIKQRGNNIEEIKSDMEKFLSGKKALEDKYKQLYKAQNDTVELTKENLKNLLQENKTELQNVNSSIEQVNKQNQALKVEVKRAPRGTKLANVKVKPLGAITSTVQNQKIYLTDNTDDSYEIVQKKIIEPNKVIIDRFRKNNKNVTNLANGQLSENEIRKRMVEEYKKVGIGVKFEGNKVGLYSLEKFKTQQEATWDKIAKVEVGLLDKNGQISKGSQKIANMSHLTQWFDPKTKLPQLALTSSYDLQFQNLLNLKGYKEGIDSKLVEAIKAGNNKKASQIMGYGVKNALSAIPTSVSSAAKEEALKQVQNMKTPEQMVAVNGMYSIRSLAEQLFRYKQEVVNKIYEDNKIKRQIKDDTYELTPQEYRDVAMAFTLSAWNKEQEYSEGLQPGILKELLSSPEFKYFRQNAKNASYQDLRPVLESLKEETFLSGFLGTGGAQDVLPFSVFGDLSSRALNQVFNYNDRAYSPKLGRQQIFSSEIGRQNGVNYNKMEMTQYLGAQTTDKDIYNAIKENEELRKSLGRVLPSVKEGGIIIPQSMADELASYRDAQQRYSFNEINKKLSNKELGVNGVDILLNSLGIESLDDLQVGETLGFEGGKLISGIDGSKIEFGQSENILNLYESLRKTLGLSINDMVTGITRTNEGIKLDLRKFEEVKEGTKLLLGAGGRQTARIVPDESFNTLKSGLGISDKVQYITEKQDIKSKTLMETLRGRIGFFIGEALQDGEKTSEEILKELRKTQIGRSFKLVNGKFESSAFYDYTDNKYKYVNDQNQVKDIFTPKKGEDYKEAIRRGLIEFEGSDISKLGISLLGKEKYASTMGVVQDFINMANEVPYFNKTGASNANDIESNARVKFDDRERRAEMRTLSDARTKLIEKGLGEGLELFIEDEKRQIETYGKSGLEAQKQIEIIEKSLGAFDQYGNLFGYNPGKNKTLDVTFGTNGELIINGEIYNGQWTSSFGDWDEGKGIKSDDFKNSIISILREKQKETGAKDIVVNAGGKKVLLADIQGAFKTINKKDDYYMPSQGDKTNASLLSVLSNAKSTQEDLEEELKAFEQSYKKMATSKDSELFRRANQSYVGSSGYSKIVGQNVEESQSYGDSNTMYTSEGAIRTMLSSTEGAKKGDITKNIRNLSYMLRASGAQGIVDYSNKNIFNNKKVNELLQIETELVNGIISRVKSGEMDLMSQFHRYPSTSGRDIRFSKLKIDESMTNDDTLAIARGLALTANADYDGDKTQTRLLFTGSNYNSYEDFEKAYRAAEEVTKLDTEIANAMEKWEIEKDEKDGIDTSGKSVVEDIFNREPNIIASLMSKANKHSVGYFSNLSTNTRNFMQDIGIDEVKNNGTKEAGMAAIVRAYMESLEQDSISAKKVFSRLSKEGKESFFVDELDKLYTMVNSGDFSGAIKQSQGMGMAFQDSRQLELVRNTLRVYNPELYEKEFKSIFEGQDSDEQRTAKIIQLLEQSFRMISKEAQIRGLTAQDFTGSNWRVKGIKLSQTRQKAVQQHEEKVKKLNDEIKSKIGKFKTGTAENEEDYDVTHDRYVNVDGVEYNGTQVDSVTGLIHQFDAPLSPWDQQRMQIAAEQGTYAHKVAEILGRNNVTKISDLGEDSLVELGQAQIELENALGADATPDLIEKLTKRAEIVAEIARKENLIGKNAQQEITLGGKFSGANNAVAGQADIISYDDSGLMVGDYKFSNQGDQKTVAERILQASIYMALYEEELENEMSTLEEAKTKGDLTEEQSQRLEEITNILSASKQGRTVKILRSFEKNGQIFTETLTSEAMTREEALEELKHLQGYKELQDQLNLIDQQIKNAPSQNVLDSLRKQREEIGEKQRALIREKSKYSTSRILGNREIQQTYINENGESVTREQVYTPGAINSSNNKQVNTLLRNLKEQYKVMSDMNRLQASMSTRAGGKDTQNAQALMTVYKQRLDYLKQSQPLINERELTEQQLNDLHNGRNKIESDYFAKQKQIALAQKQQVGFLSKLIGGFKQQVTYLVDMSLAYQAVGKIRQILNQIVQKTVELDSRLVDIQIATGMTRDETRNMLKDYVQLGKELGRTTTDVATAANDWLRAGYKGKEAAELTRASMMLSTLGMIQSADATTYLISTLKGWKLGAEDVIGVVDKLTVNFIKKCSVCLVIGIGHKFNCG